MPRPLTAAIWHQLEAINDEVNGRVSYRSDPELYAQPEFWEAAIVAGDCEDFALAKRQELLDAGWPVQDVRLAVVLTESKELHTVLTVDTTLGTYVLDNRRRAVLPYRSVGYTWLKRQAAGGSGWVEIAG